MSAPSGITRVTLLKDLRLEWRSKDAVNSMLFFSLLVVVVFSFSFDPSAEESRQIAGGLIWWRAVTARPWREGGRRPCGSSLDIGC